ncbi:MAG TPA: hypothetical protein VFO77_10645 [Actinoplanes sp.]|nr:hypothetical protein [Actinoplanes sp.]
MTVSIVTGIAIQSIALWVVHRAIRGQWLRHPGSLFFANAVLGHGITELMQWIWPGRNPFRVWITPGALDDWVLLVSVAILICAAAYAFIVARKPGDEPPVDPARQIADLRLRWLLLLTLPLLFLTWQGKGVLQPVAPGQIASRDNYATVGLASTFLVPLLGLIGAVVLIRYGTKWMIPLFLVQGALLSPAGTRSIIITACLLALVGAGLCGIRPTRGQVASLVAVMVLFTSLISVTRSVAGRGTFAAGQSAAERINGLAEGVTALGDDESREAILNDVVYRFDSNTFGTMVLQSLQSSAQPVGLATIGNAVLLTVPSFLDGDKLSKSLEERGEEAYLDRQFGLSQRVDWLPGVFGAMLGYYGPGGLLILAVLLGALIGIADRVLSRRPTTTRFVAALGVAQCALLYAAGPQQIIICLRGVLVAVTVLWVVNRWKQTHGANRRRRQLRLGRLRNAPGPGSRAISNVPAGELLRLSGDVDGERRGLEAKAFR